MGMDGAVAASIPCPHNGGRVLTIFGASAVAAMLVCYALEARSTWFVFAFGLACFGASAYGWLASAWPFGVINGLGASRLCAAGSGRELPAALSPTRSVARSARVRSSHRR
jgi:hypothetical protein